MKILGRPKEKNGVRGHADVDMLIRLGGDFGAKAVAKTSKEVTIYSDFRNEAANGIATKSFILQQKGKEKDTADFIEGLCHNVIVAIIGKEAISEDSAPVICREKVRREGLLKVKDKKTDGRLYGWHGLSLQEKAY